MNAARTTPSPRRKGGRRDVTGDWQTGSAAWYGEIEMALRQPFTAGFGLGVFENPGVGSAA